MLTAADVVLFIYGRRGLEGLALLGSSGQRLPRCCHYHLPRQLSVAVDSIHRGSPKQQLSHMNHILQPGRMDQPYGLVHMGRFQVGPRLALAVVR
jgi:hypothetical protein